MKLAMSLLTYLLVSTSCYSQADNSGLTPLDKAHLTYQAIQEDFERILLAHVEAIGDLKKWLGSSDQFELKNDVDFLIECLRDYINDDFQNINSYLYQTPLFQRCENRFGDDELYSQLKSYLLERHTLDNQGRVEVQHKHLGFLSNAILGARTSVANESATCNEELVEFDTALGETVERTLSLPYFTASMGYLVLPEFLELMAFSKGAFSDALASAAYPNNAQLELMKNSMNLATEAYLKNVGTGVPRLAQLVKHFDDLIYRNYERLIERFPDLVEVYPTKNSRFANFYQRPILKDIKVLERIVKFINLLSKESFQNLFAGLGSEAGQRLTKMYLNHLNNGVYKSVLSIVSNQLNQLTIYLSEFFRFSTRKFATYFANKQLMLNALATTSLAPKKLPWTTRFVGLGAWILLDLASHNSGEQSTVEYPLISGCSSSNFDYYEELDPVALLTSQVEDKVFEDFITNLIKDHNDPRSLPQRCGVHHLMGSKLRNIFFDLDRIDWTRERLIFGRDNFSTLEWVDDLNLKRMKSLIIYLLSVTNNTTYGRARITGERY